MSGGAHSGPSGVGGFGRLGGDIPNCSNITAITHILSPNTSLLSAIHENDLLEIMIQNNIVVVANELNEIVGSIMTANIERLIECMEEGHRYKAKVLKIDGAAIEVQIFHIAS